MEPDAGRDLETLRILEIIHAQYGFDLRRYTLASMRRRLEAIRIKAGAARLSDLQDRLLVDRAFFASIRDELTVQVSEMFRDPDFYRGFREHIVPALRTYPQIKIWHAGCAGGEEIYSVAILLAEEGLYERAQIYGTDVSAGALGRAREAVYPEARAARFALNHALSGSTANFESHCRRAYGQIAIKEPLRRNVVLFSHDLGTDYALGEMQVVFCRNVLVYFDAILRNRVIAMLTESLSNGGFLCLGASERLEAKHLRTGLRPMANLASTYRMGVPG